MGIVVVRYSTQADKADENQGLVEKVFAELNTDRPAGLRYATFRLDDGVSFVHVASVDTDDGTNPLASTAAFAEFQRQIADRVAEGPVASKATVVGSYRFWPSDPEEDVS
jgi:hypothetical protein